MELQAETRQRRARHLARKTTGIVSKTLQDARGIAEPLARYGELRACDLVALYNAIHGLPTSSTYILRRLKRHFHEAEGLPQSGKILIRPTYQWRHGYNHQTIYRKADGTTRFLHAKGLYSAEIVRLVNTTQVVKVTNDPSEEPADHDAALSVAMAGLEISIRRTQGIGFITHLDILQYASHEALTAVSPLSIPIPQIAHTFPSGDHATLPDIHVLPDALFGIEYTHPREDFAFFAVEFDRSTEDVEPSKSLTRASWLRKILCYSAISAHPNPIYNTYLGIRNLRILCIFSDVRRMANVMRLAKEHAAYPTQFLFKTIAPIDPLLSASPLLDVASAPWNRVGGTFDLMTNEEGQ